MFCSYKNLNLQCCVPWFMAVVLSAREAETQRIMVTDQLGQKVSKTSISTNKLGVLLHICSPTYVGDGGRRITIQGPGPGQKREALFEK
jgi:hypothetical protein